MTLPKKTESRFQRALAGMVGRPLFWVIFVGVLFTLPLVRALQRKLPPAPPILGEISSLKGTIVGGNRADRMGQPLDGSELHGVVWVATFLDPADPKCDPFAEQVAKIQHRAKNLGESFRMVSFVPQTGDRALLAAFIARHHVNPRRWSFVTLEGGSMEKAALDALHAANVIAPVGSVGQGRVHDHHLAFVVDQLGRIRGLYDLQSEAGLGPLLDDLGYLANVGPEAPDKDRSGALDARGPGL